MSLCSGIEAASVAWAPLGWKAAAFAEIEPFPCAVLAHHYPDVPNLGDITKFKEWPDLGSIDLICGGTPCQSFSVAGLRKGLADPRGNLSLTFLAIVDRYRPRYVIWENVPGVLSSDGGRDFAAFLGGLGQLGYGWCYRVLDAQYCRVDGFPRAVPQRRRRIFVVGYLGDWRRAAAVLSEPESVHGDSAPRREKGEAIAPTISARPSGGGGLGTDFDLDGGLITGPDIWPASVPPTLNAHFGDKQGLEDQHALNGAGLFVAHSLRAEGFDASEDGTGRGTPIVPTVAKTLTRGAESSGKGGYAGRRQEDDDNLVATPFTLAIRGRNGEPDLEYRQDGTANAVLTPNGGRAGIGVGAIAIQERAVSENPNNGPDGKGWRDDGAAYTVEARQQQQAVAFAQNQRDEIREMPVAGSLAAEPGMKQQTFIAEQWAVRRLTPTECARLQGFPDDHLTQVTWRGICPPADGPQYKGLGNSWPINVVRWIGRRIEMVEQIAADIEKGTA